MLFGEAEDITHQIECVQLRAGSATEDGEKRGVFIQKGAIRGYADIP